MQVISFQDGSASAPSMRFADETTLGFYRKSAGVIGVAGAISGILFGDGTAALPSIAFSSDPDTGFHKYGTNILGISIGGVALGAFYASSASGHLSIFGNSGSITLGSAEDVSIIRDGAADILALKRATNAQEFRVYGTTTGTKYIGVKHDGSYGKFLCDETIQFRNKADAALIGIQAGLIYTDLYIQGVEQAGDPSAPPANGFKLYAKDNAGKTAIYALFPTGGAILVATEV